MILMSFECDNLRCGFSEDVDVYHDDWVKRVPLGPEWLPDGWTVIGMDHRGYPLLRCAACNAPSRR